MAVKITLLSEFSPRGIDKAIAEFKKLETTTQKAAFAVQKAFVPAVAVVGGLAAASVPAIRAASELGEAQSAVGTIFGEAADEIEAFSKTAAREIGQSQIEVMKAAQTFGIFGDAAGLSGQDLADFATEFTTLASDLASFYDTSPEDAILAIGAALRGESEPLRRYGVLLDDASLRARALELGIYDGNGALTQQQKILAAQAEIFEQTAIQQGNFQDTAESLPNQLRTLTATFEDLQVEIGRALLPILEKLLPVVQKVTEFIANNTEVVLIAGGVLGTLAAAVVAVNAAMKVYQTTQLVVTAANKVLGTSFELTRSKMMTFSKGLGIVGAAVAAGAYLYTDYNNNKNRTKTLTEQLIPLLEAEAGGFDAVATEQAAALLANDDYQVALEQLGVTNEDYLRFIKGEAIPGLEALEDAVRKGGDGVLDLAGIYPKGATEIFNFGVELTTARDALAAASEQARRNIDVTEELGGETESTTTEIANLEEATKAVSEEMDRYRERLEESLDTTTEWRDTLEAATESGAQSFSNFQVDSETSIDEFRNNLIDSAVDAYNWQNNLLTIAQQTSPEFASYLADMGLAGATLVADLAANEIDLQDTFDAFVLNSAVMSRDILAEFDGTATGVQRRMDDITAAVENSLPPSADMRTKAMAIGDAIYGGIVDALNNGQSNVAYAAAALADTAIYSGKRAIEARSPSRAAAREIGEPISLGVAAGIEDGAGAAVDAMTYTMEGIMDVGLEEAEKIVRTIEDQIDLIWDGIGARRSEERMTRRVETAQSDLADAQERLAIITRGAGEDSDEYREAQRRVEDAEWSLADARDRVFDATQRVEDQQRKVTEALNEFGLGSPEWEEAQRRLAANNRDLEQAGRTVQDREAELAEARETANNVLNGYAEDTDIYRTAVEAVEEAERDLQTANLDLLESQKDLIAQGPEGEETFRKLAEAAGLETDEVNGLVRKYQDLAGARVAAGQAAVRQAELEAQAARTTSSIPRVQTPVVRTPLPSLPGITTGRPRQEAPVEAGSGLIGSFIRRSLGGPIPGGLGQAVPMLAHGGEYVLSADVVDAIKKGKPSRGLDAVGGGTGGGGGNVINITVTSADPQAVVEAIRRYNRSNGPAPIKVA